MKKITNITIGTSLFVIENDAYEILQNYLTSVTLEFNNDPDADEIIKDIEYSISDKLLAQNKNTQTAINKKEIQDIIEELGTVEQLSTEANIPVRPQEVSKKLYRNTDTKIIAGVASGLAQYFNIDVVIIRIIFGLSVLWGGLGILIYLVLWMVTPYAKTTAQKLEMQGKKINLSSITETSKKALDKGIKTSKNTWEHMNPALDKILSILRKIIGIVLFFGAALATVILSSIFVITMTGNFDVSMDPVSMDIFNQVKESYILLPTLIISLYTTIVIPLLIICLGGIRLLFNNKKIKTWPTISIILIWFVAIAYMIITSITIAPNTIDTIESIEEPLESEEEYELFIRFNEDMPLEKEFIIDTEI